MIRKGIKPISSVLEAEAQSLYQRTKLNLLLNLLRQLLSTPWRNRTHISGFGDQHFTIKLRMCIKSRKFASYGLEKPWLKQGLHYLFEILFSCCVAPYELSRNSTPFTGLTVTFSSDLDYSFTMAIFYNLPQFLLRGLFSIFISWATKIRTWTTRTKIWCTAFIR